MNGGLAVLILTLGICGICVLAILKIVADALQSHVELQRLVADCEKLRAEYANRLLEARERHAKNLEAAKQKNQPRIHQTAEAIIEPEPELAQAA